MLSTFTKKDVWTQNFQLIALAFQQVRNQKIVEGRTSPFMSYKPSKVEFLMSLLT